MKKYSLAFLVLFLSTIAVIVSCKKINEATELGDELIPAVDNINTFELILDAQSTHHLLNADIRVDKFIYGDQVALGHLNDPEFGPTHANFQFSLAPSAPGSYPFIVRDSLKIDSVVLSLSYTGGYGDTAGGMQTIRVYEIAPDAPFRTDSLYRYDDPGSHFPRLGTELGSTTYQVNKLKDTVSFRRPPDTIDTKVTNVIRVRFNDTMLGHRFTTMDTSRVSPLGGFTSASDSIFRKLFRGLSIEAEQSGNVLTYFNLNDVNNTKLTVYFTAIENGLTIRSSYDFNHGSYNGQTNYIQRSTGFIANGNGGNDRLMILSTPGSYGALYFPGLDTLTNRVIHRAEVMAVTLPSAGGNIFTAPSRLMLDRTNRGLPDTNFILQNDLIPSFDGSIDYSAFDGNLRNGVYRFNITRHVQAIATRKIPNDTLRLYAPLRTTLFATNLPVQGSLSGSYIVAPSIGRVANGRAIIGGGQYANPDQRLRLKIIYSKL